jgi:hypothetical protein
LLWNDEYSPILQREVGLQGRGAKWVGWKKGGWSVEVMYDALRIQKTTLSAFTGG